MKPVLLLPVASSTKFLILHYYYYLVQIVNYKISIYSRAYLTRDKTYLIERYCD